MQTVVVDREERQKRIDSLGFDYDAQPKQTIKACPLCGGHNSTLICDRDRFGFHANCVLCGTCGLAFLNQRMTAGAYAEFYERWYRPLISAHIGTTPSLAEHAALYAEMIGRFVEPFADKSYRRTALDVGGSIGAFANVLHAQYGFDCTVVDPSADELAVAAAHGHTTIQSLAEDFHCQKKFDLVAMLQTVDHLLDPLLVLRKIRSWVSDYGIAIIDFVDYRTVYRTVGIKQAIKIDHPLYFTSYTARAILARAGLEPIHCGKTEDKRHLLFVCRPVPTLPHELPLRESVEQAHAELANHALEAMA